MSRGLKEKYPLVENMWNIKKFSHRAFSRKEKTIYYPQNIIAFGREVLVSWKEKVVSTFGQEGEEWLASLPCLVESVASHWALKEIRAFKNLSYNYVASALGKRGPVVIKLCCVQRDFDRERLALEGLTSEGSIPILDVCEGKKALLLPRALGATLKSLSFKKPPKHVIPIYGQVVRNLQEGRGRSNQKNFPAVEEQIEELEDRANSFLTAFSLGALKEVRQDLKTEPQHLIHGDLHLENILEFRDGWKAIDPKGVWGPLAFEVSAYDIFMSEEEAKKMSLPEKHVGKVLTLLSNEVAISKQKVFRWTVLRCLLSAVWFVEDGLDPSWPLLQLFFLEKTKEGL